MQQLAVGNILEGKVSGITKFGAFVDFENGQTGMVHISEVASDYVEKISDYLKVGQTVKVKVLSISDEGKISLSIKKAVENNGFRGNRNKQSVTRPPRIEFDSPKKSGGNMSFEDMMTKFKQTSDDKMSDLKKYMDVKQKGSSKRNKPRM